ncbi:glycosyltransferase family 4 protein [Nakamurella deserti]|uniref:glycosyltransferase family 4 protein n=1 Tax=Nakamurella deserti TaxID=2164074 RepID=UPI00197B1B39|nr:glycosyltransferase family 4 protein [Nakamurella deserti]
MPRSILIAHPSAELYGSDRVMIETIEGLQLRGWRVVTTLPAPGPLVPEIERRGGEVVVSPAPVLRKSALRPLGMLRLVATTLRSLPSSVRLIRAADMVYVSTLTVPSWLLLSRLLRRPVVCHVHESERAAPLWLRRVLAGPLLAADHLIVNSEFSRGVLLESYRSLARHSEVVYNGVPGPAAVVPARETLAGGVRLLFVGRLSPRKGPQVAVELLRRLVAGGVPARLAVVGSVFPGYEWFEEELRRTVAEAGLDDAVTFVGFTEDVWSHLADSDIALVPSQGDEPFGNTAVEAVLAGRPVVVSSSSGLDEAVAGYSAAQRVAAGDIDGWVAAVRAVVDRWSDYRIAAAADVAIARNRHAPHIYQRTMADRLDELAAGK